MIKNIKNKIEQNQGMSRERISGLFLPKNEMEDYYMRDYTNLRDAMENLAVYCREDLCRQL